MPQHNEDKEYTSALCLTVEVLDLVAHAVGDVLIRH